MVGMQKIVVPLEPNAWHGHATETIWAIGIGGDRHKVRSVPFYARGLSLEDIVITELVDDRPQVRFVAIHSGHSTYRIFLANGDATEAAFARLWKELELHGCTYERASEHLFAVDVPPAASIRDVYALLEAGEKNEVWSFEEGHCGHGL